jgi:uncharacterized protein (DUF1810 family)
VSPDRSADPFDPVRFVAAQDGDGTFDRALAELRAGAKQTHWMWFVFPQLTGLGTSPTAVRYAIGSLEDAVAYLRHPVLGDRLGAAADALLGLDDDAGTAADILGPVDALKLRSSMTLFARADPGDPRFTSVLDRYYGGSPDPRTEELLGRVGG